MNTPRHLADPLKCPLPGHGSIQPQRNGGGSTSSGPGQRAAVETRHRRSTLTLLACLCLTLPAPWAAAAELVLYDEALRNGWQDWGWAAGRNYLNTTPTHSGSRSIAVSLGAGEGLYLHADPAASVDTTPFGDLAFWINGGAAGGQQLLVQAVVRDPNDPQSSIPKDLTFNVEPLPANAWKEIRVPLSALGVANDPRFDGFWIMTQTGGAQPVFYLDDIRLAPTVPEPPANPLDRVIYADGLDSSRWQNWSWAAVDFNNASPTHSGSRSISVTAAQWQAVDFHACPPLNPKRYESVVFWAHGGTSGGQRLQVQATIGGPGPEAVEGVYEHRFVPQSPGVEVGPLIANAWQKFTVPLAALGVAGAPNMADIWIWNTTVATMPKFYLDDVRVVAAAPLPPVERQPARITVDAGAERHPISPLIYGVAFASAAEMADLNATLNRWGGNNTTRYNWRLNAMNLDFDWYFESYPFDNPEAGAQVDTFIADSKVEGGQPMITIPLIGWVAKLGPDRARLWSFSVAKYGPQTGHEPEGYPDAGNGVALGGQYITGNDPNDANVLVDSTYQQDWVRHLTNRWGRATAGGVRYYLLDNEPSIWHGTHRDVHPNGVTMDELRDRMVDYASKIKAVDPEAVIVGPEEWGWPAFASSGADQQHGNKADSEAHGGAQNLPWLLGQMRLRELASRRRLLDVFSVHHYPSSPGLLFPGDVTPELQLLRNRSTRALWDTNYVEEGWVCNSVQLIPRLRAWVAARYPGLPFAINEYNFGAEYHMNGATAQADALGIFGREGLHMAARWTTPTNTSPTYKAMKMYRNYDDHHSGFGDVSVAAGGPDPDDIAVFGAVRSSDGALTIMVVCKYLADPTPAAIDLANFNPASHAEVWQLTAANQIARLPDASVSGGRLETTLPAPSVTLFVLPSANRPRLVAGALQAGNRLELRLEGAAGQTYVTEASTDLRQWGPVSTNVAAPEPVLFLAPPTNAPACYYRAYLAPSGP